MTKLIQWYERGIAGAMAVSLGLIGIGRLELGSGSASFGAWSVSRTTLFFWIGFKVFIALRERRSPSLPGGWARLTPLGLFFLVVTVSLLPDFRNAGDYRYFVFACFHAVMVVDVITDRKRLRWTLTILGVLPAILVVRGFINSPTVLSFDMAARFGFPLDHPNTAGYVLAMTVPLSLWCIAVEKSWRRGVAVLSCLLQLLALLLTYSRTAWVGAILAMLGYLISCRRWKALALIFTACLASVAVVPTVRDRLFSLLNPAQDASISERMKLAREAMAAGWNKPILGVGYGRGRVKEALRARLRSSDVESITLSHTHNVYVELFAGTGLLGLGSFLWVVGSGLALALPSVAQLVPAERLFAIALSSAWIAVIICGLGDVPFFHHETRILLFTLFGLIVSYSSICAPQKSQ